MNSKLTIWCNARFSGAASAELAAGVAGHRLVLEGDLRNNLTSGSASDLLAGADVAFGQPDPDQVIELPTLTWIHLTSAGYTRYDRPALRAAITARKAQITNSSGVFADPCAQHVLAFMLAQARQLPVCWSSQLDGHKWAYDRLRNVTRVLAGDTVLILGFGAIARRLVELLSPFQLNVLAVRRTVAGDEPISTFAISELDRLLPQADHLVNLLPSNPSADGMIGASVFAELKPGAIFYNVGRGATVNQDALLAALNQGSLSAAYLDVTDPEPLPPAHPLWSAPNCFITPHIAGGHQDEDAHLVRHFLRNLRNFEVGQPLDDRIM